ncbi:MAG: DUF4340 domain-containing protein [Planctomycetota bacterium]
MSARTLQVVGLIAVASLGLGVFLSNQDKGSDAAGSTELVPVLEKRLNDVAAVRIEGGDAPFTLEKSGDDWLVKEKAGYPADGAKLRQLLIELRRARRIEQKTASPSGFEQLGVQEPDAEGSESRAVVLLDAKGDEITRVIVGKRRFGKGSATGPVRADEETYVRVSGDSSAWLAAGKLAFDTSPLRWLDQVIFDVPRDRVAAAEYARPEGDALTLSRATKDEFEMKPLTVPDGREAKTPLGTSQAVNALTGLRFDDVASAAGFEWPAAAEVTTSFWTFDGLKVTAESIDKEGKTWTRFRAEVVDAGTRPGAVSEPAGPPTPAVDVSDVANALTGEGDPAAEAPPKPAGPTPEELASEAQKINAKVSGWVFNVPSWKANAFKMKLEDVLAPLPEPALEGGDAAPIDDAGGLPSDSTPGASEPGASEPGASEPGVTEPAVMEPTGSDPGAIGAGAPGGGD